MYRLSKIATEDCVAAMARATDGGGYYGQTPTGEWLTGSVTQLKRAGAANIKRATVKVLRTYL
jgi:hypothetical protein